MRALSLIEEGRLEPVDLPEPPPPGKGELQIAMRRVALNHIDLWGARGMAFVKRTLPIVAGVEGVGEVVARGPGVIGFQKLQVQRNELEKSLKEQLTELRSELKKLSGNVEGQRKVAEERIAAVEQQVAALLDQVQGRLPEQAAELVAQARTAAKDAREQVRGLVGRAA